MRSARGRSPLVSGVRGSPPGVNEEQQINELASLVERHVSEAHADLAAVTEELARPEPDREVLRERLGPTPSSPRRRRR